MHRRRIPAACLLVALFTSFATGDEKSSAPQVTLAPQSWEGLQAFVAGQKDRVVVVDVWSSWCTPCLRELPHLVNLQAAHPKEVVGVSFCLDYTGAASAPVASLEPQVLEVLRKVDAKGTRNFVSNDADEKVYEQLDLGSVPAVLVYRDGKLVKRFDNDAGDYGDEGFTYEDHVTPFVEKLLVE